MTYEQLKQAYEDLCKQAAEVEVTDDQLDELTDMGALAQHIDLANVVS